MASFPHSFSDKTPKIDRETVLCRICGKPVSLSDARTDADGKAIHEDCYALKIKFEQASGDGHVRSTRPWKVIAEEVSNERDSKKMAELVSELNRAMDEQGVGKPPSQQKK